jgi:hypothetical protein
MRRSLEESAEVLVTVADDMKKLGMETELSAFCRTVVEDSRLGKLNREPLLHRYIHALAHAFL